MEIPKDAAMLLSYVNTKLRDFYPSLKLMCSDLHIDEKEIKDKLGTIGYEYDEKLNKFV